MLIQRYLYYFSNNHIFEYLSFPNVHSFEYLSYHNGHIFKNLSFVNGWTSFLFVESPHRSVLNGAML